MLLPWSASPSPSFPFISSLSILPLTILSPPPHLPSPSSPFHYWVSLLLPLFILSSSLLPLANLPFPSSPYPLPLSTFHYHPPLPLSSYPPSPFPFSSYPFLLSPFPFPLSLLPFFITAFPFPLSYLLPLSSYPTSFSIEKKKPRRPSPGIADPIRGIPASRSRTRTGRTRTLPAGRL